MKNLAHLFVVVIVASLLGACASGTPYDEYASTMQSVSADSGRIYIYRTSALGAAIQPAIRLNGEVVGKAVPKGFFFLDRPSGAYEISASTEAKRSLSTTLDAGEEKYVRLEIKMGLLAGHVKPVLVDRSVGEEEIKKTKYVGE